MVAQSGDISLGEVLSSNKYKRVNSIRNQWTTSLFFLLVDTIQPSSGFHSGIPDHGWLFERDGNMQDFVKLKFEQRLLIQLKRIIDRPAGRRRCRNYTSADFGAFPPHRILGPRPPVIPCASVFVCDCPCLSILSTYRCFIFSRLNSVFLLCITLKVM